MRLRTVAVALAAGLAAFLAVGAAVTEFTLRWIEFSLFVGIPVGLLAGLTAAAVVVAGLGTEVSHLRRRVAVTLATFGVAFLLALGVAVGAFAVRNSHALVLATAVGAITGAGAFALDYAETAVLAG
ncbi:hypothetical protein ACFQMA_06805 [Halosimplex aquaticum]|uniref:DUF8147 domain-containing protein n=1 Tax=Halosimplex aquaticum TaxID=3026162 RepID=A0ABD5Y259_9EURY|nr:hypothetical protein [Halosimplex aquaticum]